MHTLLSLVHDSLWHELVQKELYLSFMALLSTFTPEPLAFRSMMRSTNSIISGSTALNFLLRQKADWTPGDIDIIAPEEEFNNLLHFIQQIPGAAVTLDVDDGDEEFYRGLHLGHRRLVKVETGQAKFDLMQSRGRSAFNPIPYYWGTHVMNALTADSLFCAYPTWTLQCEAIITGMLDRTPPRTVVEKYKRRHFVFTTIANRKAPDPTSCADFTACAGRDRFFGDDDTLLLAIPHENGTADVGLHDGSQTHTTAWRLGGKACGNRRCFIPGDLKVCTVKLEKETQEA